jgi:hypothetical protein
MIVVSFATNGRPRGCDRGRWRSLRRMVALQVPWIADPVGICQSRYGHRRNASGIIRRGDKKSLTKYRHCRFSDHREML